MIKILSIKKYKKLITEASKFDYMDIYNHICKDIYSINRKEQDERYKLVRRLQKYLFDLIKYDAENNK